jgi:gliding motility-associated-like protein
MASISGTTSSTPSICSNDGTLTVNPAGGTAPYTISLLSGPANPNITYPVTLAPGLSTFGGLPSGSYSIQIIDAGGTVGLLTGTVGGNYSFPNLSFNISTTGTITATVSGGRGPFQYSISSTGSNVGFGTYQGSGVFSNLCPGNYWIRVIDSCGNLYTNEVTFTNTITSTLQCVNFSQGTLDVTAAGGTAPYTFSLAGVTNTTGHFTGLPNYFSGTLTITDACGVQYTEHIAPPPITFNEKCPSDSVIYLTSLTYPVTPTTFTFNCTNCVPPQSVTLPYDTPIGQVALFQHQPQSTNYNIVVTSTACGGDTFGPIQPAISSDIVLSVRFLSCRSFQATVTNNGSPVPVDSFVLTYVKYGPTVEANTTGLFENIPDSNYVLTANIGPLCGDTPRTFIHIPYFPAGCFTLMRDATCHNAWEYSIFSTTFENYSIVVSPGDTVPSAAYNRANFYNLAPSTTYTIVSDSGCAEQIVSPPATAPAVSVVAYLPCVGQPVVKFTGTSYTYCGGSNVPLASVIKIHLTYGDSLIYENYASTDSPILVNINSPGYYHYRVYATNLNDTSSALRFDTICPIDTGTVFMNNVQVPYLLSNVGLVCDSGTHIDTISYQVFGGSAPYTVEIPGFDTVTLQTNTGIFPTHQAGTYTMIVYDVCGISRSVTFNIVDTCSNCPYAAISLPDTFSCAGDTIRLTSTSIHAATYQWFINGVPYSTSRNITFVSGAGGNTIKLRVVSSTGCADSVTIHTSDTCRGCPYAVISLPDTMHCIGDAVHLTSTSISGVSFRWLINGQLYSISEDTIYNPTAGGTDNITLIVISATACIDSAHAHIYVQSPPGFINLPADTTYCGSFTRVLSTGVDSTHWSTGETGAQITVDTAGTYTAKVMNRCGSSLADIVISQKPKPIVYLGPDTSLCDGSSVILNARNPGDTYVWSTGPTTQSITVHTSGTYQVTVTLNGCSASDAIKVTYLSSPAGFSLGNDTTVCVGYPFVLDAYQPYTYYTWSNGSTSSQINVDQTGTYIVTDSNACGVATDSINVAFENCSCKAIIPTAFSPNGDGLNDKYGALAPCIPENFLLQIFDRWGERLFASTSITEWWDGTYKNKPCPLSVYVYTMKYTDPYTKISYFQSGNVTLMK